MLHTGQPFNVTQTFDLPALKHKLQLQHKRYAILSGMDRVQLFNRFKDILEESDEDVIVTDELVYTLVDVVMDNFTPPPAKGAQNG